MANKSNRFKELREAVSNNQVLEIADILELIQGSLWYSPTNKVWQIYHPDFRHGTIIAPTIGDVVQKAKLYILNLEENNEPNNQHP